MVCQGLILKTRLCLASGNSTNTRFKLGRFDLLLILTAVLSWPFGKHCHDLHKPGSLFIGWDSSSFQATVVRSFCVLSFCQWLSFSKQFTVGFSLSWPRYALAASLELVRHVSALCFGRPCLWTSSLLACEEAVCPPIQAFILHARRSVSFVSSFWLPKFSLCLKNCLGVYAGIIYHRLLPAHWRFGRFKML